MISKSRSATEALRTGFYCPFNRPASGRCDLAERPENVRLNKERPSNSNGRETHKHTTATTAALRTGFSILELVVAMTLGLVLMSAIWTMFSIFTKGQEIDRIQTEKSQLVRGLHQLLSRDLTNIVPQSSGSITGGAVKDRTTSSVSPLALSIPIDFDSFATTGSANADIGSFVGTVGHLQILVFDEGVASDSSDESSAATTSLSISPSTSVDWPYKSIVYRWESATAPPDARSTIPTTATSAEQSLGKPGLSRRESFYGSRGEPSSNLDSVSRTASSAAGFGFQLGSAGPSTQLSESTEQVISEETVSEFSELTFEYFDGSDWRESWDSRETGTLPTAVRIGFNLRFEKTVRPTARLDSELIDLPTGKSRPENVDALNRFEQQFTIMVSRDSKPTKASDDSQSNSTLRTE